MTQYTSLFLETQKAPAISLNTRLLIIDSDVPLYDIASVPVRRLHVARRELEGWELYDRDIASDHRGIPHARFLNHHNEPSFSERLRPEKIFVPFVPLSQQPGEFITISDFPANPRSDRLKFSAAGDEVTLNRFYAYGPKPLVIQFRCVSGEAVRVLPRLHHPRVDAARLPARRFAP